MKITKISIEEFKKLSKIDIHLEGLNILVGANGSGKSSVLQAIHLASCLIRQTEEAGEETASKRGRAASQKKIFKKKFSVDINELDYLPTNDYVKLGHKKEWKNKKNSQFSKVEFFSSDEEGQPKFIMKCLMQAARNTGISVDINALEKSESLFSSKEGRFFSAYIPGISGVPNREEERSKRVILKACSFGDANNYLRNILNILYNSDKNINKCNENIDKIEYWLKILFKKEIKININYNSESDLFIDVSIKIDDYTIPIELLGAGYIQLIQIFCYILLFKPRILLIDEPDIHLHPDVQEALPSVLSNIAKSEDIQILIATHSPFILRGAPLESKIHWIENGKIVPDTERNATELALS